MKSANCMDLLHRQPLFFPISLKFSAQKKFVLPQKKLSPHQKVLKWEGYLPKPILLLLFEPTTILVLNLPPDWHIVILTTFSKLTTSPPPFDAVAHDYDAAFTETAVGRLQRELVWAFLKRLIDENPARSSVLEFNCGTGEDALWLAQQGCQVLATDISAQMLAMTRRKVQAAGLEESVATEQLDLSAVERFIRENPFQSASSTFHLILSNFGGLNCLSPVDLLRTGKHLPDLLAPDGYFVAVIMGRFCWQESLYFLLKGRWRTAFRRFSRKPVAARLDEQTTVDTWYYSSREFRRFFPDLELVALRPVGLWVPPSYLDTWFRRWPKFLHVLGWLERHCQGRFWAWGADHFLICLRPNSSHPQRESRRPPH